jgi:hypothetical protein
MITGKIFYVHQSNSNDTISASDSDYFARVDVQSQAGFSAAYPNGEDTQIDVFYVTKDSSSIASLNISTYPCIVVALDKFAPKVYLTEGVRTDSYLKTWFKNLFLGNVSGDGVVGDSAFGFDIPFVLDRKCNAVDEFLKFIHLDGTLKRAIYGVGAGFFGFKTVVAPNNLVMSINGGISAAFLYLFFGKEECPFDVPTLEQNGKTIAIGAGISVGLLAFYQLYLKDELAARRLAKIVGAASGNRATTNKTSVRTSTTRKPVRKRPKSVTRTVRYS